MQCAAKKERRQVNENQPYDRELLSFYGDVLTEMGELPCTILVQYCYKHIQVNEKSKRGNIGMVLKGRRQDRDEWMHVAVVITMNRHMPYIVTADQVVYVTIY